MKCKIDPSLLPPPPPRDGYKARYIIAYLVLSVFFVAFVTLFTITHVFVGDSSIAIPSVIAASVSLFVFVVTRSHDVQTRLRAGNNVLQGVLGFGSCTPRTIQELRTGLAAIKKRGETPTIVGGAWSNVLQMQTSRGSLVYTRHLFGEDPNDPTGFSWLAGTSLVYVQKALAAKGLQIASVPSYEWVSVGAWVATQGHGMAGPFAEHSIVFASALVLDLALGIETTDGPDQLLEKFGSGEKRAGQYVVLSVRLSPASSGLLSMTPALYRESRFLKTIADARWLIDQKHVMSVVFIGHEKTILIGWKRHDASDKQAPGSGALFNLRLALFAVLGWGSGNVEDQETVETVTSATKLFSVFLSPFFVFSALALNAKNYELFSRDLPITAETLVRCSEAFQPLMKEHGGRLEFRFIKGVICYDVFQTSEKGMLAFLHKLAELGIKTISYHPGKAPVRADHAACAGLTLVSQHQMHRLRSALVV
jgi:hypothetical protein